ncbi:DNA repair protein XRCC4-like [Etheostoma cragini]|uniref:DNA repair protein XRCC4-like n=1 Tax=Etheostoma cragini TaxID=417921 RepID=UPI00155EAE83|nr:DNA repair protein XRCC4-like [Etheostoma cragini]
MHVSVREVHVSSEPDSSFFLRVDWKGRGLGSGFQVLLTDGQDAWRGDVSEAGVCREAEELEMQPERYVQDLERALTETESSVTYSFTLTPSPAARRSALTLAYEKVQKDISAQYSQDAQTGRTKATSTGSPSNTESTEILLLTYNLAPPFLSDPPTRLLKTIRTKSEGQKKDNSAISNRAAGQEEDDYTGSTDEEPEEVMSSAASVSSARGRSTASPLDDSLKDIPDVAPCRKRRFRHVEAPAAEPQSSQRKSLRFYSQTRRNWVQVPPKASDCKPCHMQMAVGGAIPRSRGRCPLPLSSGQLQQAAAASSVWGLLSAPTHELNLASRGRNRSRHVRPSAPCVRVSGGPPRQGRADPPLNRSLVSS